ncbi:MAG: SGNH/GDSL hydrolase family protein [Planctomycetaceae bacterium]
MRSILFLLIPTAVFAQDSRLQWIDAKLLTIEGQAWNDTESPWDRFPAKAKSMVRPAVWSLSQRSAGICIRFRTRATAIHAKWNLTSSNLDMPHMPSTGVSGVDLYARDKQNRWRWVANGRPAAKENNVKLVSGLTAQSREFMLYLPLYNGVTSVEIAGKGDAIHPSEPRARKPIVFYGTSITQGGCASRPGMVHTAILGRWLDVPIVNLGFSGNGRMEAAVGKLMSEIDASVYVIDCLPNITAAQVTERTFELVKKLRAAKPGVPIVLVEDRDYTDSVFVPVKAKRNQASQAALKVEFQKLKAAGVKNLHYIEGKDLLGDDGEGTVDSSHPTDLGFMRQARVFHSLLEPLLSEQR